MTITRTRRTRQKGGPSICRKCLAITPEVFAAEIEKRRQERKELLMARSKSVEEELDDLDLDDLDDIEDEVDEDEEDDDLEDDEDEDDEDPDEAPKARKSKSKKSKKSKAAAPKKKSGVGTKELADEAGVEPRVLRAFLRSAEYQPRDEREGRYSWPSLRDPEAREIIKKVKGGEAERVNKAKLAALKEKAPKKSPTKKSSKVKSSTKKSSSKKKKSSKK